MNVLITHLNFFQTKFVQEIFFRFLEFQDNALSIAQKGQLLSLTYLRFKFDTHFRTSVLHFRKNVKITSP
jgi:hypothetical protein